MLSYYRTLSYFTSKNAKVFDLVNAISAATSTLHFVSSYNICIKGRYDNVNKDY